MIDPQISGKVVLITGANHGIGAASARAFARLGARVFITAYRPQTAFTPAEMALARESGAGGPELYAAMQDQPAEAVAQEIRVAGGTAAAWEYDLSEAGNIPRLFDRCEAELGPVDILVNNHTYCVLETFDPARVRGEGFPVSLVSAAEIDAHFIVNARAYALLMAEYTRRVLDRQLGWGRIINLSTDASFAHDENVSYAASKHAIESYSRSAASELGRYGITVNVVAPGPIQTGYITPEMEADIARGTPLGRVGQPEDVADVIVFLASAQARWLTGQLIFAGGGWRMPQ
jgi:3-oxoacyl-[acyl-carrier protein] reductase